MHAYIQAEKNGTLDSSVPNTADVEKISRTENDEAYSGMYLHENDEEYSGMYLHENGEEYSGMYLHENDED